MHWKIIYRALGAKNMREVTLENIIIKFKNGSTLEAIKNDGAARGHRAKLYPMDYYIDTKIIDEIVAPLCVKEFYGVNSENQILYVSSAFKGGTV